MKSRISICLFLWLLFLAACSNTRHLTDEEILYTGREKVEILSDESGRAILPAEAAVTYEILQIDDSAIPGTVMTPTINSASATQVIVLDVF